MILHLIPKVYSKHLHDTNLLSANIMIGTEVVLSLYGDTELMLRRPYPNKCYTVACRRKGNRGLQGFIVNNFSDTDKFSVRYCWMIDHSSVRTLTVNYDIVGDGDIVTDDHKLYHNFGEIFPCLRTDYLDSGAPVDTEPRLNIDEFCHREVTVTLPKIEIDRYEMVSGVYYDRLPSLDEGFDMFEEETNV